MESSEIIENDVSNIQVLMSDFNDENDHYEETVDDYDETKEDNYDDGIANSNNDDGFDDGYDDDYSEDSNSETVHPKEVGSLLKEELEDSLQESEDYDELDD